MFKDMGVQRQLYAHKGREAGIIVSLGGWGKAKEKTV